MADAPSLTPALSQKPPSGVKFCHRFMIPATWMEQQKLGMAVMRQQMGFVPCIKEACTLYDEERRICLDVIAIQAAEKQALWTENAAIGSEH